LPVLRKECLFCGDDDPVLILSVGVINEAKDHSLYFEHFGEVTKHLPLSIERAITKSEY